LTTAVLLCSGRCW